MLLTKQSKKWTTASLRNAVEMEFESEEKDIPVKMKAAALKIGQIALLSRIFANFSEHCADAGPFKTSEIAKMLPRTWNPSEW